MSEQTDKPRPYDTVRVAFKGRVLKTDDHGRVMSLKVDGESAEGTYIPASASVEILERAVILCGVYEGMTGIQCQLPKGHIMPDGALRTVHEGTSTAEQTEYIGYETFIRWPADSGVWTPAAEAEKPFSVELKLPPFAVGGEVERAQQQRRFRYFTKKSYLPHRITPSGDIQYRHPNDGWTTVDLSAPITPGALESYWDEVDVEPIGGVS